MQAYRQQTYGEKIYKTILRKKIHIRHSFTVLHHVLPWEMCYGFIGCKKLDITAIEIRNYMMCLLSRNFRIRNHLLTYVTENFSMKMQFQLKENSYSKDIPETLWTRFLFFPLQYIRKRLSGIKILFRPHPNGRHKRRSHKCLHSFLDITRCPSHWQGNFQELLAMVL